MKNMNIVKALTLFASTLLCSPTVYAMDEASNTQCTKTDALTHSRCWYVGGGYGLSHLRPEIIADSGWQNINDDNDKSFKGFAGVSFGEHLFSELSFENLGHAGLHYHQPGYSEDDHTASYTALTLSGGYWLRGRTSTWDIFVKAGYSYLENVDEVSYTGNNQLALGLGTEWRFTPKWLGRFEFTRYDEDVRSVGISVARYLGKHKSSKNKRIHSQPAAMVAPTIEPSSTLAPEAAPTQAPEPNQESAFDLSNSDIDNDGVINTKDICPSTAEGSTVDNRGCPVLESINLNIQFDTNLSDIKSDFIIEIEEAAEIIKGFGDVHVTVEGHTDGQGSEGSNQKLSESRAQAVAKMLIEKTGLESHKLSVVGHGELKPIADNDTAEGRYRNRRVMVLISQP